MHKRTLTKIEHIKPLTSFLLSLEATRTALQLFPILSNYDYILLCIAGLLNTILYRLTKKHKILEKIESIMIFISVLLLAYKIYSLWSLELAKIIVLTTASILLLITK